MEPNRDNEDIKRARNVKKGQKGQSGKGDSLKRDGSVDPLFYL